MKHVKHLGNRGLGNICGKIGIALTDGLFGHGQFVTRYEFRIHLRV